MELVKGCDQKFSCSDGFTFNALSAEVLSKRVFTVTRDTTTGKLREKMLILHGRRHVRAERDTSLRAQWRKKAIRFLALRDIDLFEVMRRRLFSFGKM